MNKSEMLMRLLAVFMALLLTACSDLDQRARQAARSMNLDMTTRLDHSADPAGPDLDKNGIRDDIDLWISKQKFTIEQTKAMNQYARILQKQMVKPKSKEDARVLFEQEIRASNCVGFVFNDDYISTVLYQSIFNTRARKIKEDQMGSMISGMGFSISHYSLLRKEQICD